MRANRYLCRLETKPASFQVAWRLKFYRGREFCFWLMREITYTLAPEIALDKARFEAYVRQDLNLAADAPCFIRQVRRSIDARKAPVKVIVATQVFENEPIKERISYRRDYQNVAQAEQAIVVGAGPAGLFAALRLIELGIKPILIERGKDVKSRTEDIANISRRHLVNPESNYCFGEGGAGTYSDGKLYTRSKKRGDWRRILEIFVAHGASEDILIDAHPHIGTNKLPRIVAEIRKSIIEAGGEVHFNTKVVDLIIERDEAKGVVLADGEKIKGIGIILATGHSARDIFELLDRKKIEIAAKAFALGVRIEHRQCLIDSIQYHRPERGLLPAASYALVEQVAFKGQLKGVFSFCMCPGGFIVPSATEPGEVVVNGMSPSRRNSKYANSGIVVAVEPADLYQEAKAYRAFGNLAVLRFQQDIERKACALAGGTQAAPAQLMVDFVEKRLSKSLLDTSYQPGLVAVKMDEVLPAFIAERLRKGFVAFGRKMKGYLTDEAQIVGVESRTSSPVRIPRAAQTREHTQIKRLFPSGEGAGYAGGIASAAIDGERCAEMLVALYAPKA